MALLPELSAATRLLLLEFTSFLRRYHSGASDDHELAPSPSPTAIFTPMVQRTARKLGLRLRADEMVAFAADLSLSSFLPALHGRKGRCSTGNTGVRPQQRSSLSSIAGFSHIPARARHQFSTEGGLYRTVSGPVVPAFARSFTSLVPRSAADCCDPIYYGLCRACPFAHLGRGGVFQGKKDPLILVAGEDLIMTNLSWAARTWGRMSRSERTFVVYNFVGLSYLLACTWSAFRTRSFEREVRERATRQSLPAAEVAKFNSGQKSGGVLHRYMKKTIEDMTGVSQELLKKK